MQLGCEVPSVLRDKAVFQSGVRWGDVDGPDEACDCTHKKGDERQDEAEGVQGAGEVRSAQDDLDAGMGVEVCDDEDTKDEEGRRIKKQKREHYRLG